MRRDHMLFWLLTSTTYGTWLPGDQRGFVSNVQTPAGPRERHNKPGTPYDSQVPELERVARGSLKGPPVRQTYEHAKTLLAQWQTTATIHEWRILAAAVMSNHFHLVVGAAETHHGSDLLRDFKSFGSRRLTEVFGRPLSGTWWTSSGSKRHLANAERVAAAVRYVMEQEFPLVVWRNEAL